MSSPFARPVVGTFPREGERHVPGGPTLDSQALW